MVALSRATVRLLAVTCAVAVANLYYAQPLLGAIAGSFGTSPAAAGLLVTVTQLGYAAGLLFVVPLGDIRRRRPLLTGLLVMNIAALALSAAAPNLPVLAALAFLTGLGSVAAMIIVPFAAGVAAPEDRGQVLGTVLGGMLLGILLSRTFSGVVAAVADWRGVYAVAAVLMLGATAVLRRALPDRPADLEIGFGAQMRGILAVFTSQPVLRSRALIGACAFGAFSCFWTTVPLELAGPDFGFSELTIAIFALVGAAGAASSLLGGRLLDSRRHLRWQITGAALGLTALSFALLGPGAASLPLMVLGALLMDGAVQGVNVVNQSVIHDLLPQARSRLTSAYMTTFFVGGAVGSTAGAQAYGRGGWPGACAAALLLCLIGLVLWAVTRGSERAVAAKAVAEVAARGESEHLSSRGT